MTTIAAGIDIALQINASRAFQKLAAMEQSRYAEAEAIFGPQRSITQAEIAELEEIFGN